MLVLDRKLRRQQRDPSGGSTRSLQDMPAAHQVFVVALRRISELNVPWARPRFKRCLHLWLRKCSAAHRLELAPESTRMQTAECQLGAGRCCCCHQRHVSLDAMITSVLCNIWGQCCMKASKTRRISVRIRGRGANEHHDVVQHAADALFNH